VWQSLVSIADGTDCTARSTEAEVIQGKEERKQDRMDGKKRGTRRKQYKGEEKEN